MPPASNLDFAAYLREIRALVLADIRQRLPVQTDATRLYDLVLDYPLRAAKALRPALCVATCRALGGSLACALPSATALELYHNAFLIHDDIEDQSETRRGEPTLHLAHGVPMAVNVGDAMLALALEPLLENTAVVGVGPALLMLQTVAQMARISAEGQALELEWMRDQEWTLTDADYLKMIEQKTAWYTFIAPVRLGALAARQSQEKLEELAEFARVLGLAFQIRDDWLNLAGQSADVGKEPLGDLWEGKRTLMLLHLMRNLPPPDAEKARLILAKQRPGQQQHALVAELEKLRQDQLISQDAHARLRVHVEDAGAYKQEHEIAWLHAQMQALGSLAHVQKVADELANQAEQRLAAMQWLEPSVHREFLAELVKYAVSRAV